MLILFDRYYLALKVFHNDLKHASPDLAKSLCLDTSEDLRGCTSTTQAAYISKIHLILKHHPETLEMGDDTHILVKYLLVMISYGLEGGFDLNRNPHDYINNRDFKILLKRLFKYVPARMINTSLCSQTQYTMAQILEIIIGCRLQAMYITGMMDDNPSKNALIKTAFDCVYDHGRALEYGNLVWTRYLPEDHWGIDYDEYNNRQYIQDYVDLVKTDDMAIHFTTLFKISRRNAFHVEDKYTFYAIVLTLCFQHVEMIPTTQLILSRPTLKLEDTIYYIELDPGDISIPLNDMLELYTMFDTTQYHSLVRSAVLHVIRSKLCSKEFKEEDCISLFRYVDLHPLITRPCDILFVREHHVRGKVSTNAIANIVLLEDRYYRLLSEDKKTTYVPLPTYFAETYRTEYSTDRNSLNMLEERLSLLTAYMFYVIYTRRYELSMPTGDHTIIKNYKKDVIQTTLQIGMGSRLFQIDIPPSLILDYMGGIFNPHSTVKSANIG